MRREQIKKERTIQVKEILKIRVGDKEYIVISNTPTSTFYADVYGEITAETPEAKLGYIRYVAIHDATGYQVCWIDTTASKVEANKIQVEASCTWNSTYPPDRVKIYSDAIRMYFEVLLPPDIEVPAGSPFSITWEATFSISITSASGFLAGASLNASGLIDQLTSILANQRGNLLMTARKTILRGRSGTNYNYVFLEVDVSRDPTGKAIILSPRVVEATGDILYTEIYSLTTTDEVRELLIFTHASPLSVREGDLVGYTLVLV